MNPNEPLKPGHTETECQTHEPANCTKLISNPKEVLSPQGVMLPEIFYDGREVYGGY